MLLATGPRMMGTLHFFIADNEQLEAAAVSKDILLKISNGVEPHDICILCKQKPQDYASAIIDGVGETRCTGAALKLATRILSKNQ